MHGPTFRRRLGYFCGPPYPRPLAPPFFLPLSALSGLPLLLLLQLLVASSPLLLYAFVSPLAFSFLTVAPLPPIPSHSVASHSGVFFFLSFLRLGLGPLFSFPFFFCFPPSPPLFFFTLFLFLSWSCPPRLLSNAALFRVVGRSPHPLRLRPAFSFCDLLFFHCVGTGFTGQSTLFLSFSLPPIPLIDLRGSRLFRLPLLYPCPASLGGALPSRASGPLLVFSGYFFIPGPCFFDLWRQWWRSWSQSQAVCASFALHGPYSAAVVRYLFSLPRFCSHEFSCGLCSCYSSTSLCLPFLPAFRLFRRALSIFFGPACPILQFRLSVSWFPCPTSGSVICLPCLLGALCLLAPLFQLALVCRLPPPFVCFSPPGRRAREISPWLFCCTLLHLPVFTSDRAKTAPLSLPVTQAVSSCDICSPGPWRFPQSFRLPPFGPGFWCRAGFSILLLLSLAGATGYFHCCFSWSRGIVLLLSGFEPSGQCLSLPLFWFSRRACHCLAFLVSFLSGSLSRLVCCFSVSSCSCAFRRYSLLTSAVLHHSDGPVLRSLASPLGLSLHLRLR